MKAELSLMFTDEVIGVKQTIKFVNVEVSREMFEDFAAMSNGKQFTVTLSEHKQAPVV